uniref:Uncharacterized protein n=1 Tax=Rhizophora mucronata TaxID=61149 RepID=A0A2P2P1U8_RHIMU
MVSQQFFFPSFDFPDGIKF